MPARGVFADSPFAKGPPHIISDPIDAGIEILPMKAMQEEMSSGPGY
jgi:hypothetical protein